jgi:hypothetical protein
VDTLVLSYDHTGGYSTSLGITNTSTLGAYVQIFIRDDSGALLVSDTLLIPYGGQMSFDLATQYGATTGIRGTVELDGGGFGGIGAVGLRASAGGELAAVVPWPD